MLLQGSIQYHVTMSQPCDDVTLDSVITRLLYLVWTWQRPWKLIANRPPLPLATMPGVSPWSHVPLDISDPIYSTQKLSDLPGLWLPAKGLPNPFSSAFWNVSHKESLLNNTVINHMITSYWFQCRQSKGTFFYLIFYLSNIQLPSPSCLSLMESGSLAITQCQ